MAQIEGECYYSHHECARLLERTAAVTGGDASTFILYHKKYNNVGSWFDLHRVGMFERWGPHPYLDIMHITGLESRMMPHGDKSPKTIENPIKIQRKKDT